MNSPDKLYRTALHYAAAEGNAAKLRLLVEQGENVNAQDANGWSPLHFAAQASSAECTDALLRSGANATLTDAHGNTALFRAVFASKGQGDVIKLLLAAGADPFAVNSHGVSPLTLARSIANFNIAVHLDDLEDRSDTGHPRGVTP